ncbi:MAG TPA: hypothetical protein VGB26_07265 [Nitrospiria bacterium]|jgi:hypothetical protein
MEGLKKVVNQDQVKNMEELEDKLLNLEHRIMVVVEDLQNLYLKTVDGFDTLERFLLLISRTQKNIYWLTTCSLYSWKYLDRVIDISRFFQGVVYLGGFTKENIEQIILKRHKVSGFKLRFEPTEEIRKSKRFMNLPSEEERQGYPTDSLFREIRELSTGNIMMTLMFWLSAIHKIEEDTLILSPTIKLDETLPFCLPPEEVFTLALFLQREIVMGHEHALVFHQEIQQSLLLLKRMANKGILLETKTDTYTLNPLLNGFTVKTLKMKNILH